MVTAINVMKLIMFKIKRGEGGATIIISHMTVVASNGIHCLDFEITRSFCAFSVKCFLINEKLCWIQTRRAPHNLWLAC